MKARIRAVEDEISEIKRQLMLIDEMRPGSLSEQKRSRGSLYHQLSYRNDGRGHTEYVRKEQVSAVRQQLEAYRAYATLNKRWISLSIELCRLKAARLRPEQQ